MSELLSPDTTRVREIVKKADSSIHLSLEETSSILQDLEKYECWTPYFRLIEKLISSPTTRSLDLYIKAGKAQNLYLEDVFGSAQTCIAAVRDLKLSYKQVTEEILPQILSQDDFASEATIMSSIAHLFTDHADHIQALERLCLLYEKKVHNDRLLTSTYEKLLNIDEGNVKALRYFKLVHTQNGDWEEVAHTLRTLIRNVTYPQELYRVAQELAAVLLYHLDRPKEAVRILETYCADSPLDMSTILYDAYDRLGDDHGCLKILRQSILAVSDEMSRAKVLFKIGVILERLGDKSSALEHYRTASSLWPTLLDAVEGVVTLAIEQKNWPLLATTLESLESKISDERLKGQLRQAIRRLKDGVENASRT